MLRGFCAISQQAEIVLARISICWPMDTESSDEVTSCTASRSRLARLLSDEFIMFLHKSDIKSVLFFTYDFYNPNCKKKNKKTILGGFYEEI